MEEDKSKEERPAFRLQVECFGLFRFLTVVDPDLSVEALKRVLEKEIMDLYGWDLEVRWLKDPLQNDLVPRYAVSQVLKDFDQVYIYVERIEPAQLHNAANAVPLSLDGRERERDRNGTERDIAMHASQHHHHGLGDDSDMTGGGPLLFHNSAGSPPPGQKNMWARDMDT